MTNSILPSLNPVVLQPMTSAPPCDYPSVLLVLDEFSECGTRCRVWRLVSWHEAWDGSPAGWFGTNGGDLCHPLGWTHALSGDQEMLLGLSAQPVPAELRFEFCFQGLSQVLIGWPGRAPSPQARVVVTGATPAACRTKLQSFLSQVQLYAATEGETEARHLRQAVVMLQTMLFPEHGFHSGGDTWLSYEAAQAPELTL